MLSIKKFTDKEREELLSKIEEKTEMPLLILVVIMIVALVLPLIIKLDKWQSFLLEIADWIIWAVFFIELSIRTYVSPKRLSYLKKNWIDILEIGRAHV